MQLMLAQKCAECRPDAFQMQVPTGRDADAAKKQGAQDATAKTTVGDVGSISVTEDSEDL